MALDHCPGADFPLLLPTDASLSAWEGFLCVADCGGGRSRQLWLRLEGLPGLGGAAGSEPPFARARLLPGPELEQLLGPAALAALRRCLAGSSRLPALLRDVAAAAQAQLDAGAAPRPRRGAAGLAALASELRALGPALAGCEAGLGCVRLRFVDAHGRAHALRVALPPAYPAAEAELLEHDLPQPPDGAGGGLAGLLRAAQAAAARWAPVWAELEALDGACWVLEPAQAPPPRAAAHRRVALGGALTLWLAFAPPATADEPPSLPQLRVDGPEADAAPLRARLAAAAAAWAPPPQPRAGWLLAWLAAALGAAPPPPAAAEAGGRAGGEADNPSCAICFAFPCPDSGQPPAVACDACRRPFHASCLAECLRAAAGPAAGAAAGSALYGECPYCSACVAVKG